VNTRGPKMSEGRMARSVWERGDLSPLWNGTVPPPNQKRRPVGAVQTLARIGWLLALVVTGSFSAHAQPFAIDWFTIDGGGGMSTGGVYSVNGTIGQPDAGEMSGGQYSLVGGFWGVVAIQTPGAPLLAISLNPQLSTIIVSWPLPATGFVLDQTLALSNAPPQTVWSQVAMPYQTNATHISITVPMPAGNKFYRLRKP